MNYNVYLLKNTHNNRTYLGITNNLERRLRQHNNEIKGGAKYTHNFRGNGIWYYYRYISGLSKSQSLSIERSIKNNKNKTHNNRLKLLNNYALQYEKNIWKKEDYA